VRNPSAAFTRPTEDEWYKAAYSDPANPGTYHAHPTGSPIATSCTAPNALPDSANCDGAVGATTDVGSYPGSASANAAFDLGGNVWEWTESIAGVNRRIRGGSFTSPAATLTATSSGFDEDPLAADAELGFRVVPEPGPIGGLVAGWTALAAAAATRRRPPLDTNRTS
ncbi:MAG: SUMF1/EgtB/PvdO family nonheme iron enzyme, partial [Myxococcota bacterium]